MSDDAQGNQTRTRPDCTVSATARRRPAGGLARSRLPRRAQAEAAQRTPIPVVAIYNISRLGLPRTVCWTHNAFVCEGAVRLSPAVTQPEPRATGAAVGLNGILLRPTRRQTAQAALALDGGRCVVRLVVVFRVIAAERTPDSPPPQPGESCRVRRRGSCPRCRAPKRAP